MQVNQQPTIQKTSDGILARHKVLRQTYTLLAMNVLFSAFCAFIGMKLGIGEINPIIYLVGVLGLSFAVSKTRNSGMGIIFLFAFTGFLGLSLSQILSFYFDAGMGYLIYKALIGAAIIFFGLSAYAVISGKNFNFLGGFLFAGLIIGLLASLAAMFFHMPGLQVMASAAFLMIFSSYVLFDTSRILRGEETNYIMATMDLFINLFNIFISLLNILSALDD